MSVEVWISGLFFFLTPFSKVLTSIQSWERFSSSFPDSTLKRDQLSVEKWATFLILGWERLLSCLCHWLNSANHGLSLPVLAVAVFIVNTEKLDLFLQASISRLTRPNFSFSVFRGRSLWVKWKRSPLIYWCLVTDYIAKALSGI